MPRPDPKHPHGEEVRLQAFLAHSGVSSRRAAEELIAAGQVFVNGKSVTAPGTKIRPGVDEVEVQGQPVEVQPVTWLALHKPKGYVTTRIDPYGRKTVYELIPDKYHGLFHVGRLDRDSEGLLLLTNEGDLANRMLHPSYGVTKEYWADVEGKPTAEEMHRLTEGVEAKGDTMQAESVRRLHQTGENQHRLSVVMREGKKREVRRMLEALGHPVARLIRRRFGPVALGELKPGKWRILADAELATLREPSGKRPSRPKRLHSGDEEGAEPAARPAGRPPREDGGERRPQRKPKPDERARPAAGAGKPAAPTRSTPRPSELRAKAREDAVRGRSDEAKPRRGPQVRDERPYHERDARGAPAKRGPVKRVRDAEARPSVARGPVKRVRDDERPSTGARGPVKRVRDGDDRPSTGTRGPVKRVRDDAARPSTGARGLRERDMERGPSPRDASRGFPRSSRPKVGGPARPDAAAPRPTDGDREMDAPYPQTRRGSASVSPRGGAPDERRGAPDRPRPGRPRDADDRPGRAGGKPVRGGKPARGGKVVRPPRGRDDGPPSRRPFARDDDDAPRPRSRPRDDESPVRRSSAPPRGRDEARPPRGRGGDDDAAPRRSSGPPRGRDDARPPRGRGGDDDAAPRRSSGPSRGRDDARPPRGRGGDEESAAPRHSYPRAGDDAPRPRGGKGPGGPPKRGGAGPKRGGPGGSKGPGGPKRGGPPSRRGGKPRGR